MSNLDSLNDFTVQNSAIFAQSGQVDQNDSSDVYQFSVNQSGVFTASLTGLTGDADFRLIHDKNGNGRIDQFDGEILAWQWERGTQDESIRSFVESGEYFLQVNSFNDETANYQLMTNFQESVEDERELDIQVKIKDDIQGELGLTNQEYTDLVNAIENASELWEAVIPYSSGGSEQTLKFDLKLKDLGDEGTIASAGGKTIKYNINPDSLKGRNDFKSPGIFQNVIVHEIGHLLGITDNKSSWGGNIDKSKGVYKTGTYASWTFGEILGTFQPTEIPITTNEGGGSDYSHWDERVFSNEIMTHASGDIYEPLSQLTVSALRDIGWSVNYGAAQEFEPFFEEASLNLLIEKIQALDEDGIGGDPKFYGKIEIDGKKYSQTGNAKADGNFDPVYPNWPFSKDLFYDSNRGGYDLSGNWIPADNWIPIKIGIYDKDEGPVFDGARKDDHVDINRDPDERDLKLEYNLLTGELRNRETGFIYTPDINGLFYSEGDNETEPKWGDFDRDGDAFNEDGSLEIGPSDKVGIWFSIETVLPLASVLPDGTLKLNLKAGIGDFFTIKHISGVAGSEVVDITANGVTQRYGPGTPKGAFSVIEGIDGDGNDTIILDGVLTTANLDFGAGGDTIQFINSSSTGTQGSSIIGGTGNDTLLGGAGNDSIHGDSGIDILGGGSGNDHITGGGDDDDIEGGAGNDVLSGDSGDPGQDTVSGGEGDDIIGGGGNDDILYGDEGDDIIWGDSSFDIIDVRTPAAPGTEGNDIVDGGSGNDEIHGEAGDDTLIGSTGEDEIYGDEGDDEIWGDLENDLETGDRDLISGGDGDDVIHSGGGDDAVSGDAGNDTIFGGNGNDVLNGDTGDDVIHGGEGDDTIHAGSGNDTIDAGIGNDLIDGGTGIDTVTYKLATSGIDASLETGVIHDGWGTQDTIVDHSVENLIGSAHDDLIIGDYQNNQLQAGAGNDRVEARDGNDRIFGEDGDDELFGEDGDDFLDGGTGNDYIDGGDGYDTASLASATGPTFTDLMTGISFGGVGNDKLISIENLQGSEFEDWMGGDNSANSLDGGGGNDTIYGRAGDDRLHGGSGADRLYGEDGNDELHGQAGVDMLKGGDGDDLLDGGADDDQLYGHDGDDVLKGGDGNDILEGNDGDDLLEGGSGHDRIYGQNGDDVVKGGAGSDFMDGGRGTDTVDYYDDANDVVVNLSTGRAIDGGGAHEQVLNFENIIGSNIGNDWLVGNDKDNNIQGNGGDDTIYGGAGSDTIAGGDGDDQQYGEGGNDLFLGDSGDDHIDGGTGTDQIDYRSATAGIIANLDETQDYSHSQTDRANEQIDPTNPVDYYTDLEQDFAIASGTIIEGFGGVDTVSNVEDLEGTEFDDIVIGSATKNMLNAHGGNDLVIGNSGDDFFDGGDGIDTVSYRRDPGPVKVDLSKNKATDGWGNQDEIHRFENIIGSDHSDGDQLIGSSETDNIITAGAGNDYVDGLSGADSLYGEQGDDTIIGGFGQDTLYGNQGNDIIWGDRRNDHQDGDMDTIYGGAGDDEIYAGGSNDLVYGDSGDDEIWGDSGYDFLDGGQGNDIIHGGDNDDFIYGQDGNNKLHGDEGNDYVEGGQDNDLLYGGDDDDHLLGLAGDDHLDGGDGEDFLWADDGDDQLQGDKGSDYLDGGSGNDSLDGGRGFDTLYGQAGNDVLDGGQGNDYLNGGDGSDELYGGSNEDWLCGGADDDLLNGGRGNDMLEGGQGADIFVLTLRQGFDTIFDFEVGIDMLQLEGNLSINQLVITQGSGVYANDTFISDAKSGDVLTALVGVQADTLGSTNFMTV